MTIAAWTFMILMWGVIAGMTGYCFYRLLTSERQLGGDD